MLIDGIPLQRIDRNVLRSRIIALPQDTFFLPDGNSCRANLSPYHNASTAECEAALEEVGLWTMIKERGGLEEPMKADSLSQGQKQLFSVARAVLRARERAKEQLPNAPHEIGTSRPGGILLLDEITSSVDGATDGRIQQIIRKEFEGYTIIAVAHRTGTVRGFDRVIVMENGEIKESRVLRDAHSPSLNP
jgi:ATP-binding cassette, subfamily C (CFTR/MRP), member 1